MKNRYRFPAILLMLLSWAISGPVKAQYYMEDRWPNLQFFLPVGMYTAPDQSKRIFVLEQNGRIKVFKDSGTVAATDTSTFLSLRGKVHNTVGMGAEYGLLGMAFHPNFVQNGYVFVNYTRALPSLTTVVSRFTVDPQNPNRVDPASEKILMEVPQSYNNHNAGSILFGDDGYLYITMGDGGSGGDPGNRGQNKSELLGKILRIDVNVPEGGAPYAIPPTNPFVNNTFGWKKEIVCTGMRNPWKMSKDPAGKTIWIADVGQSNREEIDTLRIGANYGWKIMEGNRSNAPCGSNCDTSNYERPVYDYPSSVGRSITGGFVYRGTELPKLNGAYVYGDYVVRRAWFLQKDNNGIFQNSLLINNTEAGLSSFGLDHDNELYILQYRSLTGKLMKVRCGPPTPVLTIPSSGPSVCTGDSLVMIGPSGPDIAGFRWSTGDTTRRIVLRAEGEYTLSLQTRNAFGCWSYDSRPIRVRINPKPTKPIVSGFEACAGDENLISLPSELNYVWSTGQISDTISLTNSGSYWVVARDSVGCKSDTAYFSATFQNPPATPAIALEGGILSTSPAPGATFLWFLNGVQIQSGTDTSISVTQPGRYQVQVVSSIGCRSDTSIAVTLTRALSGKGKREFLLSPNPFRDVLEITWPSIADGQSVQVEIMDAKGAKVYQEVISSAREGRMHRVDTRSLPKGAYTVSFRWNGQSRAVRLVKD